MNHCGGEENRRRYAIDDFASNFKCCLRIVYKSSDDGSLTEID